MKGIFKYIIFLILIVVVIFVNVSGINAAPSDSSSVDYDSCYDFCMSYPGASAPSCRSMCNDQVGNSNESNSQNNNTTNSSDSCEACYSQCARGGVTRDQCASTCKQYCSEESSSQTCECYYSAVLRTDDNGDPYDTYYLASIKFNKNSYENTSNKSDYKPQISFFGEMGYNTVSGSSGKIKPGTATWFYALGLPSASGLSSSEISTLFSSSCNCSVLPTLTFFSQYGSKELYYNVAAHAVGNLMSVFSHERVEFWLITKEQFDEQKNSNDIAQATKDQGFTASIENILKWADEYGYDVDSVGEPCTIIAPAMKDLLSAAFWIISILGIILVVVMTAISFIKAIVGSDDEKFRNAFSHLIVRIVTVIILLLLPMVLGFIINIINDNFTGTVQIGDDNSVFCDIA